MRKIKRVLSICLSLVLIVCTFPIYSSANNVIETAIAWATGIANDNTHGYSQANRYGPDYDCSSLVTTAFRNAGINVPYDCNTRNMKDRFVNAGFVWIPASSIPNFPSSSANLKRGDILLKSGHTELYIGNNQNIGAHDNYNGIPGGIGGGKKWSDGYKAYRYGADEIDVCKYWNGSWTGVLRYKGGSSTSISTIPTDCSISVNKASIKAGETVVFTYNIKGATTKGLGIDKNGTRYYSCGVGTDSGTTSYTFTEPGTYCCIIEGYNSIGYNCSHGVWITVNEAEKTVYTITYNANGGSGGPSSQQKNKGQCLTLSSEFPERFGYSFVGWSTSSTAEKAQYIPGSTFKKDADTTLYAVWSSVTELSSKLGKKTGALEFPYAGKCKYYKITPEKDGSYRFEIADSSDVQLTIMNSSGGAIGRFNNYGTSNTFYIDMDFKAGETYFIKIESKKAGTINYAFRKIYTLTYDTQGGTNGPAKQIKLFDVDIKTSSKIPTKEGYTFLGWSLSPDSTEVKIKSGSVMKYTGNHDDILYAVWEKNEHEHEWVLITEKKPTCTKNGFEYEICNLCGEIDYSYEIPATGHTPSEWEVITPAEVGKTGLAQIKCINCGEILDEEIIPALEHLCVFMPNVTEPTCGTQGYTDYLCECGAGYTGEFIEPTNNHIDTDNDYVCDVCSLGLPEPPIVVPNKPVEIFYGDANGDGVVNDLDAMDIFKYLVGWDINLDFEAADAYYDGTINDLDAMAIFKYLVGWDIVLGI